LTDLVLSGFLRIVTHPRILKAPAQLDEGLKFVETLRTRPNCVLLAPCARHWEIFVNLCRTAGARGNLIPDAFLAALAIETGSEWITADRDYARFPGLKWRVPV
jgi:toxin-antitoxin system PIN domain toxin